MPGADRILLVEDSRGDAFLFRRAAEKAGLLTSIVHHAVDGEEAIQYLSGTGRFADRATFPIPSIIFIDLKMPKVSGFDLLTWIQDKIQPRQFSTVVLTGSDQPRDKQTAISLGADHYWVKTPDTSLLVNLLHTLKGTISPTPPRIVLLAEDNEDDAFLISNAVEQLDPPVRVIHVSNGESALSYVTGQAPYTNREEYPLPDLVLLDLQLPSAPGIEVLKKLRQLPGPPIPIIVMTSSLSKNREGEALTFGASACLEKPCSLLELREAMAQLFNRFFPSPAL